MVILLLQKMSMQTSKIEGAFPVFRQNEAKEEESTMWLESVIYHKGRTKKSAGAPRRVGLAWVALNIVVFVYRAYNSHAKGTVLF